MAQNSAENAAAASAMITKRMLYVKSSEADDAAMFYKAAFGFVEVVRSSTPHHIELDFFILSSDERYFPDHANRTNISTDDSEAPAMYFSLQREDVGAAVAKAVSCGAAQVGEVVERGGISYGRVKDPYGCAWQFHSPGFVVGRDDEPWE